MTKPAAGLLVLLVGAPGAGKSTWASRHFTAEQIVSSDALRGRVCGDPNNQQATPYAVTLLHTLVGGRLRFGLVTLVDATNAEATHREALLQLARAAQCPAVAVVLDVPLQVCLRRNRRRVGARRVPETFVRSTHVKISAMLAAAGADAPAGFAAAVIVATDGTVRVTGQIPAGYRDAEWLRVAHDPGTPRNRVGAARRYWTRHAAAGRTHDRPATG